MGGIGFTFSQLRNEISYKKHPQCVRTGSQLVWKGLVMNIEGNTAHIQKKEPNNDSHQIACTHTDFCCDPFCYSAVCSGVPLLRPLPPAAAGRQPPAGLGPMGPWAPWGQWALWVPWAQWSHRPHGPMGPSEQLYVSGGPRNNYMGPSGPSRQLEQ